MAQHKTKISKMVFLPEYNHIFISFITNVDRGKRRVAKIHQEKLTNTLTRSIYHELSSIPVSNKREFGGALFKMTGPAEPAL
jgi:hypothetical protein